MNNDASGILDKILSIIDYQNDKNKFIFRFFDLVMREALVEYLTILSEERKKELQIILLEKDITQRYEHLEPYISTEEYKQMFQNHTEKLMQNFIDKILPTLLKEQKNNLNTYFNSLATESTPATL